MDELRDELSELLSKYRSEITDIRGIRSTDQRTDILVGIMRDVYKDSSLILVNDNYMAFDGFHYRTVAKRDVIQMSSLALTGVGVGATDIRRMSDMALDIMITKKKKTEKYKIGFKNCVYDMRSDEQLAFSRDNIIEYVLPYNYDPDADCIQWRTFLDEVMPDDNMKANLQEFFGMCYVNRKKMSLEKMAIMVGSGANGKSVIFDVMKHVIGVDRMGYLTPDQLTDPKQVVSVADKMLNFSPDVRAGSAFDSAIKALVSSQEIQGWELYKGNVVVRCPPLSFALNEMPYFNDTTAAFFRRILLFPFDIVIPEYRQDKMLATRIVTEEISGVFNWVMEGRKRLLKAKGQFTQNPVMIRRINLMRANVMKSQHPIMRWLEIMGWSTKPLYVGHMPTVVTVRDIFDWLDGAITKEAILSEMTALHVSIADSCGNIVSYYLYKDEEIETV